MDGLLLNEGRPRLVVGKRVDAALRLHPCQSRLQQRVALGMHQHQPVDRLHLAHAVQELGVADVRI